MDPQHYEQAPLDTTSHSVHDQSSVIPGTNLPIQSDVVNLEKPVDTREERYDEPNVRNEDEGITRKSGPEKMEIDFERPSVEARRPGFENVPQSKPDSIFIKEAKVKEPMVQISPLMGLEEDPHSPKSLPAKIPPSNYQAKVTDPTGHGGKEAEVAPLVERLNNLQIHDKSQSHDQIIPQSTPTVDQFNPESNPVNPSKIPESPESFDQAAKPESMPRDTVAGKISSATSAIAGKAVSAKDMVASKLGYGDVSSDKRTATQTAVDYGHKVAEKLAPVYGKVAGDAVAGGGSGGGVTVKEYFAEKLKPGEEDKALSEAITGRFYKRREGMAPGRVMEAKARSGTAEEASGGEGSGGGGVVDRLKGAVGSWIGKSAGIGLSDGSVPVIKEEIESEPRVQESSI